MLRRPDSVICCCRPASSWDHVTRSATIHFILQFIVSNLDISRRLLTPPWPYFSGELRWSLSTNAVMESFGAKGRQTAALEPNTLSQEWSCRRANECDHQ